VNVVSYVVGVDIGGTFTDCAAVDEQGNITIGKALSTGKLSYKRFVLETLVFLSIGFVVGCLIGKLLIWIF